MKVVPKVDVYIDNRYRVAGEPFDYDGPPDKNLVPVSKADVDATLEDLTGLPPSPKTNKKG